MPGRLTAYSIALTARALVLGGISWCFASSIASFDLWGYLALIALHALIAWRSWPLVVGASLGEILLFSQFPKQQSHHLSVGSDIIAMAVVALWIARDRHALRKIILPNDAISVCAALFCLMVISSSILVCNEFLTYYHYPWASIFLSLASINTLTPWHELFSLRPALTAIEGYLLLQVVRSLAIEDWTRARRVLILISLPILLFGWLDFWVRDYSGYYYGAHRASSFFQDPNCYAQFLLILLGLSLPTQLPVTTRRGVGTALFAITVFGAILTTGTRGALVATLVITTLPLVLVRSGNHLRRYCTGILFALLVSAFVVASISKLPLESNTRLRDAANPWLARFTAPFEATSSTEQRSGGRLQLWHDGLRVIAQHPLWGIGTGTFYRTSIARDDTTLAATNPYRTPHNALLYLTAELGLLGALPAFTLALLVIFTPWRLGHSFQTGLRGSYIAATLVLCYSLFDDVLLYPEHFLLFASVVGSLARSSTSTVFPNASLMTDTLAALALAGSIIAVVLPTPLSLKSVRRAILIEQRPQIEIRATAIWRRESAGDLRNWRRAEQEVLFRLVTKRPAALELPANKGRN